LREKAVLEGFFSFGKIHAIIEKLKKLLLNFRKTLGVIRAMGI